MKNCLHPQLRFDALGHALICSDCYKRYLPMMDNGYMIDFNHYVLMAGNQFRSQALTAPEKK